MSELSREQVQALWDVAFEPTGETRFSAYVKLCDTVAAMLDEAEKRGYNLAIDQSKPAWAAELREAIDEARAEAVETYAAGQAALRQMSEAWHREQGRAEVARHTPSAAAGAPRRCTCANDGNALRCPFHTQADYDASAAAGAPPDSSDDNGSASE